MKFEKSKKTPAPIHPRSRCHRTRASRRPLAHFAHQEDESVDPLRCSAPTASGHGCVSQPILWSHTSTCPRLATPKAWRRHSFLCGTRVPNNGLGFFGLPRGRFNCKMQAIMRRALPAVRSKPQKTQNRLLTHSHELHYKSHVSGLRPVWPLKFY